MSLQFVMGPSGSGKSHYLYQYVTEESLKNPEKNYFVLVPDQFTMQTQKDLVMASPRKGILNVDVLSFSRLAYRVFEETGANQRIVLNDVGKSFVLRKIAGDLEPELRVLGGNLKKTGFISEVKSVISEFTQYDVQDETLEQLLKNSSAENNFYYKLKDIKTIYKGFQNYLQEKYITGEELLDLLCEAVPKSKILKDSVIVFDGFTGFTPIQNKLIRELLLVSEKIVVTVTMGKKQKNDQLFSLSDQMLESLMKTVESTKVEIDDTILLGMGGQNPVYRFKENEPLAFLEANLFRYSRRRYEKEQDSLSIYSAKTPKEEIDFVAQRIRNLVRTKGMRYREIAIITSDMNTYANYVEKVFSNYDIPVFMDHKRSILLNSFVEYLRSLLAMAEQNFTYESVFRYLRTDLTEFTMEEIDLLENYCVALGIRGYKKWQEKWIRRTNDMEEADLAAINQIRERFVQNIEKIMDVLRSRSKTVMDITKALHDYLLENQLQQKLKGYDTRFAQEGEMALEKEYAQIYRIVMELFDQFVELLGEESISLKEYCELLDAGLEEAKVGIIPPSLDQVVVGDIERTRIKDVKILFFVGVSDVYIPGKANAGGLLSEMDRDRFEENKVALAPNAKEKSFIQKFYLYLILTKPSEKVILTYSRTSAEGSTLRPAYLVFDLLKMYPKMSVEKIKQSILQNEMTQKSGISYLVEGLQKKGESLGSEWQELYTWYKKNEDWAKRIEQIVEASFYEKPSDALTKETAEKLYGRFLSNSVTRLEKFSACAYAHFLTYGLRLKEREIYQFQAVDLGNLFHSAMEHFSTKLENEGYTWISIAEKEREALIEESVEESIINYGNTILYSSSRNEYMITRLKRMMKRTIWALTKQLERGDFIPEGFEIVYDSGSIPLDDYNTMRLHGKIDRVDVCETDKNVFVKIIDYKTGTKAFDLSELYHGLQMQLVIYMNAAMNREAKKYPEKKVVPAGLFYYQMKDPIIGKQTDDKTREELLLKELRMDGVVNESSEVISRLDHQMEGQSCVIPVAKNKNGSLSKTSKVLSEEDFLLLAQYASRKARNIGSRIMQGETEISPYVMGDRSSCSFCQYKGICGFDEKISGYRYRKLEKFKGQEEILQRMREEAEAWE